MSRRDDPFALPRPALVSFSGGRTSAYMLYRILERYGGRLPDDIVVVFANTGKEHERTLIFVDRCATRWNVPIVWLEARPLPQRYAVVDFGTASRNGEPFANVIAQHRGFLPNRRARFCTNDLKIRPMVHYATNALGWTNWYNVVGLRADEGWRVAKVMARNRAQRERFTTIAPLFDAGITLRSHVLPFWLGPNGTPANPPQEYPQGFDLQLLHSESNCDLCFLKGRAKLMMLMRLRPDAAQWWIDLERAAPIGLDGRRDTFIAGTTYAELRTAALAQDELFPLEEEADDIADCGVACGADDA